MEPRKLPDREKTRKTLRMIGLALGLWLLGSGLWGLFMTPPKDRAVSGCAELVRVKDATHWVHAEHPAVVTGRLRCLLNRR